MKISALKTQVKNKDRVSVFVDGKYSFSLSIDQVLDLKVKNGQDLDETQLKVLKKHSEDGKTKQRTLEWLLRRPHSERETRDYLFRKQVDKDFKDELVAYFKEKNYIDDVRFAEWFSENRRRKNKSDREIASELSAKGIKKEVISGVVGDLEKSNKEALRELHEKVKGKSRYQDKEKLKQYLYSKGFKYEDIKQIVN